MGKVFFYKDKDGNPNDAGIVDEPLANEKEYDEILIKAGIKDPPIVLRKMTPEEIAKEQENEG